MKKNKMLLNVNERPPILKWLLLSFQHVAAMFGATIMAPILVNTAAGGEVLSIPVTLIASGIGTLIYIACTKGKSPVYLGSSFAFITPMAIAYMANGKSSVFTGIMVVGLIYILCALIVKIIGNKWINKLLPPVVVGPMIMIIGLSLASNAVSEIGLNLGVVPYKNIIVAFISFLVTALLIVRGKGIFKVIPFLAGIIFGYVASMILGMVDYTSISSASFFELPNFYLPFLDYQLNFGSVLTIAPIALVSIAEHIGDHKVLGTIIGSDLTIDPGLDRTLLGDGLATLTASLIGGPANTTYGENTSVVGMTKVASVYVTGLAAVIAIIFGFLGKLTGVFASIPNPVLGGVSILLYGFISVNGLKILIQNKVDFDNSKNVIVASTMFILGLGGAIVSVVLGNLSVGISGMSLAAIVGILLNVVIPDEK